jgi:mono/diheme cytochrome c family protein
MNYPFWDTGIGYGVLMATIAIVHVFISHFAIGGGLYLVIVEHKARKANDNFMLGFLKKLSKFFVLYTVVLGALTGVGIWFIIGLLNPAATEVLIHNFVWGWAIEWTFFVVEITAAILYFYGWDRMSAKGHLILGWIYFAAAWLSLVIINGIVAFMLTPGNWLTTGSFWAGFFNPTYWPSLFFRTGVCIMLAGLLAITVASTYKPDASKAKLIRYNAIWGVLGLIIMAPSFFWYLKSVPADIISTAITRMATPINAADASFWLAGGILVMLVLFGFLLAKRTNIVIGILMLVLGLGYFGSFEWTRESLRKPFVITNYMYANGTEVAKAKDYEANGYLANMAFHTENPAKDLFRRVCRSCHTMNGYHALKPKFDGTDAVFIAGTIIGLSAMQPNMPPFQGTEKEARLIAEYIYSQIDHRPFEQIYNLKGVELGKKVYEIRCGKCHVMGGYNDKTASLAGLTADDYNSLLDMASDMAVEMPPFTGDSTERQALVAYLLTLKEGAGK